MNDISFYLPRISKLFQNLDERVYARMYTKWKLAGAKGNVPTYGRMLTLGTIKMIRTKMNEVIAEQEKETA